MKSRNISKHCLQRPWANPLTDYEVYQISFKGVCIQSNYN